MAIITIFSGTFCQAEEIAQRTARNLGYDLIDDEILFEETVKRFPTDRSKLERAIHGKPSFLNSITREKEKNLIYLKAVLSELMKKDSILFQGFAGLLLPKDITHNLRIYINANIDYRIEQAVKSAELTSREANKMIRKSDHENIRWTHFLFGKVPWEESLYDILIPIHSTTIDEAVNIIQQNTRNEALITTEQSQNALDEFILGMKINAELLDEGHNIEITYVNGIMTILINKYVVRLENYKEELKEKVLKYTLPESFDINFNRNVSLPNVQRQLDTELPSKILLVDDEIEFVHTLSERLQTRKIDSSVVYDGEEALSVIEEGEPEVMILDLKMPGIDGIEVLRKVKATKSNVEVIILTGHGSEKEREMADELGAFAYLEKPVDIGILTKTMQDAYKKINANKSPGN